MFELLQKFIKNVNFQILTRMVEKGAWRPPPPPPARPPRRGRRRRVHALSGTVRRRRTCGTTNRRGSALPTGNARPTCIYRVPLRVIYRD